MSINRLIGNTTFNAERADYIFADILDEPELIKMVNQEYTDLRKVDYFVDEDCKLPMSFTQIQNVDRHQFGDLPKKHTRHSKNNRINKVKNNGINIKREVRTLNFED